MNLGAEITAPNSALHYENLSELHPVTAHSNSSSSSTSVVQSFTTTSNSGNDLQIFSRRTTESIKTGKGKATLMDTKSHPVQWEILNFSSSGTDNKFRCINPGLGGIMPRANNMITVVSRGEETPRKCTGTKSSKIGNNDFNCNKEGNFHPRQK